MGGLLQSIQTYDGKEVHVEDTGHGLVRMSIGPWSADRSVALDRSASDRMIQNLLFAYERTFGEKFEV